MAYRVTFETTAERELDRMRVFDAQRVYDAIGRNLHDQPSVETRNKKRLEGVTADFDFNPPLWELRVGEFRAYYDVDETERSVSVKAVRRKPPGKMTTQETLHAQD